MAICIGSCFSPGITDKRSFDLNSSLVQFTYPGGTLIGSSKANFKFPEISN